MSTVYEILADGGQLRIFVASQDAAVRFLAKIQAENPDRSYCLGA